MAPLILKKNKKKSKIWKYWCRYRIIISVGWWFNWSQGKFINSRKKTGKDKKKGKATLISLLGYKNTVKYAEKLIFKINSKIMKYGSKSKNLSETLNYILNRNRWKKNTHF